MKRIGEQTRKKGIPTPLPAICKCSHHENSHRNGKDCLAIIERFGKYCPCSEFRPIKDEVKP